MANVDLYRQHIQNLLSQHASLVWDDADSGSNYL
jgi:hypothetical protein